MKPKAIHQFHSGSAFGDAVTNGLLYTKRILTDLGFESKIFVEHVAPEYTEEIEHYSTYESDEENILLLHHSMGHDLDEWIENLKDKIILVYHNITPETFFEKDSIFYHYSLKGRRQLELLKDKSIAAIGDSQLNLDELIERGFNADTSTVIPLLLDYNAVKTSPWSHELFDNNSKTFNILFIGRVAENKCQHEIIEVYNLFKKKTNLKSKCFIVGGTSGDEYEKSLYEKIVAYGLEEDVVITGKVSTEDLYAYYRLADVFLCLSEHEGFGVPLVESMIFDLPIIAYDSSNIKNTLNNGGLLFKEKNYHELADTIFKLSTQRDFRRESILKQREAVEIYKNNYIKTELIDFFKLLDIECNHSKSDTNNNEEILYQFEGPFDSSYSLAILNREMARSLNKTLPGKVSLFSTEGGGDFPVNEKFIQDMDDVVQMSNLSKKAMTVDVVLRNLYPPRVYDAKGLINLTNSYGWEESSFPKEYIDDFNQYLDALPVMSKYVQKVMKDNGLTIDAPVVGVGVDHMLRVVPKEINLETTKTFKFLHISSCFPRKGVDVLLGAYFSTFTSSDDICLVIKTFPNIHNDIEAQILKYQEASQNYPEIELINEDLAEGYIVSLYQQCNCLVGPSRGEGYGMPMAEAMLFNLPVITTGYGGQVDFCTDETSWLIDYSFEKTQTHMGLFNSYWAEPNVAHLSELMKTVSQLSKDEINKKTTLARKNILDNHKWENCTNRIITVVDDIKNKVHKDKKNPKIGWATTWNSKCGIASYSKSLIDQFSDEVDITIFANIISETDIIDELAEFNVRRVWSDAGEKDLTHFYNAIVESEIEVFIIQFNFGFFNLYALENLIQKLQLSNIKVFIEFHSVADVDKADFKASLGWIKDTLKSVDGILAHGIIDINILKEFSLINNVTLFPLGVMQHNADDTSMSNKQLELGLKDKFVIASYGFMLPSKGIKELIEAFSKVRKSHKNAHLLLVNAIYPADASIVYASECKELIKLLNLTQDVTIINEFLSDEESLSYLNTADLLVMPYRATQESASAAVRHALSTNKPTLCTPQNIFKDIEDIVHFTQDDSIDSLAQSISLLIKDQELLGINKNIQTKWLNEHDWNNMSGKLAVTLGYSVDLIKNKTHIKTSINKDPQESQSLYQAEIHKIKNFTMFYEKSIFNLEDFCQYDNLEFIEYAYKGLLKREVDKNARIFKLQALESGTQSKEGIIKELLFSEEGKQHKIVIKEYEVLKDYYEKYVFNLEDFCKYENQEFIEYAYRGILKREIEHQSRVNLLQELQNGLRTKKEILCSILLSEEAKNHRVKVLELNCSKKY